jgi:hypothetical protein
MRHPDVIDASAISAFFALCAAGVLLALITSQRRNPALLAILGAAAGVALAVAGAHALLAAHPFFAALWRLPVAGGEPRIDLLCGVSATLPRSLQSACVQRDVLCALRLDRSSADRP